jgi:hypothetical protein
MPARRPCSSLIAGGRRPVAAWQHAIRTAGGGIGLELESADGDLVTVTFVAGEEAD